MPELPEIQAHAERLTEAFGGAVLEGFGPLAISGLKTALPDPSGAVGQPLATVTRRGKLLIASFGPLSFVVHLMQGGRLEPDRSLSARPRGGVARWAFADGRALLLAEPGKERKAGVWVIDGDPLAQPPLDRLGPEADAIDVDRLGAALSAESMRIHGFLRDQAIIAGIGRRLANEICHRARLSPFATSGSLDDEEIERLHEAITACIAESLADERTRDHMVRSRERTSAVHRRSGSPCPACGDEIRAVTYRSYEIDYCPTCQTGGRILADNTTSRFLK